MEEMTNFAHFDSTDMKNIGKLYCLCNFLFVFTAAAVEISFVKIFDEQVFSILSNQIKARGLISCS
jgi:hypothetical protein